MTCTHTPNVLHYNGHGIHGEFVRGQRSWLKGLVRLSSVSYKHRRSSHNQWTDYKNDPLGNRKSMPPRGLREVRVWGYDLEESLGEKRELKSVYLSFSLSVRLTVFLSVCLSVCISAFLMPLCWSFCVCVCLLERWGIPLWSVEHSNIWTYQCSISMTCQCTREFIFHPLLCLMFLSMFDHL